MSKNEVLVLVLFGLAAFSLLCDVASTFVGIRLAGKSEGAPFSAWLISNLGLEAGLVFGIFVEFSALSVSLVLYLDLARDFTLTQQKAIISGNMKDYLFAKIGFLLFNSILSGLLIYRVILHLTAAVGWINFLKIL